MERIAEEVEMEIGESEDQPDQESEAKQSRVYLPAPLAQGEEWEFDKSAYVMYHEAYAGDPCLSFDILKDNLGTKRDHYPLTAYIVVGTQGSKPRHNKVIVMKWDNLYQIKEEEKKEDDSEDDESSDEEDETEKPIMTSAPIPHNGCVNRIRATQINDVHVAATWSEFGKVHIWNLTKPLGAVNDTQAMKVFMNESKTFRPTFSFSGHSTEGFALDWSPTQPGYLATGDCRKFIHIWKPHETGQWNVDQRPYTGHTASVEDLQWSPYESNVLASCSVDKSIKIWDIRAQNNKAAMLSIPDAHESDVNVINWNRTDTSFIVSGGDDGVIKVWDLRQFQSQTPVASFKHHSAPITSVEWNPNDSTEFAVAGSDDQLTQWDLSVEKDDSDKDSKETSSLPPQLLFIHQGQESLKELHWHPQLTGVVISTANSGFNIFRTISV